MQSARDENQLSERTGHRRATAIKTPAMTPKPLYTTPLLWRPSGRLLNTNKTCLCPENSYHGRRVGGPDYVTQSHTDDGINNHHCRPPGRLLNINNTCLPYHLCE